MNAPALPEQDERRRRRRRRRRVGVFVALVLSAGFAGGAFWAIPVIQNDLTAKVSARLAADGVKGVTVKFSGQDGTLGCVSELADADAVRRSVLDIEGVRVVRLAPTCTGVTTPTTPGTNGSGTTSGSLVASPITPVVKVSLDSKVMVSGQVASALQGYRLVDAATKAYGAANVASTLSVGDGAGPRSDALVGNLVSLVSVFAGRLQAGEAGVLNDKLYLKGTTADDAALTELTQAARIAGVASGDIALAVSQSTGRAGLKMAAVFVEGTIKLTGTVSTEGQMQLLINAAERATSPQAVTTELQVHGNDGADPAADNPIVAQLAPLIEAMPPNLLSGEVGFDGTAVYANGVFLDDETKAAFSAVASASGVTAALEARPSASTDDAATMQQQLNDYVSAHPILFDSGKAVLLPASDAILDRVAAIAKRFAGTAIEVQGHTDSTGDGPRNLKLSQQRAAAVVAALVTRGVPTAQLVAKGYGETQPKVANDTAANQAINRRIEFAVTVK